MKKVKNEPLTSNLQPPLVRRETVRTRPPLLSISQTGFNSYHTNPVCFFSHIFKIMKTIHSPFPLFPFSAFSAFLKLFSKNPDFYNSFEKSGKKGKREKGKKRKNYFLYRALGKMKISFISLFPFSLFPFFPLF